MVLSWQKQADATQAQFNAGSLTRTDVAQAQARLSGAQSDLTAAQSQLAISNANFLQAIGRQPETLEVEPALPPALPTSVDDSIVVALKQNPAIVSARENEVAADYFVNDQIVALPTLVRRLPEPLKRVIGDLSNLERVMVGLDLRSDAGKNNF